MSNQEKEGYIPASARSSNVGSSQASPDGTQTISPTQSPSARASLRVSDVSPASVAASASSSSKSRPSHHDKEGYIPTSPPGTDTRASVPSAGNQKDAPMLSPRTRASLRASGMSPTAAAAADSTSPKSRPSHHDKEGYIPTSPPGRNTRASVASAGNQMASPMLSPRNRASLRASGISPTAAAAASSTSPKIRPSHHDKQGYIPTSPPGRNTRASVASAGNRMTSPMPSPRTRASLRASGMSPTAAARSISPKSRPSHHDKEGYIPSSSQRGSTRISGTAAASLSNQMASPMQSPRTRASLRMSNVAPTAAPAASVDRTSIAGAAPGPSLNSPLNRPSHHEKEGYIPTASPRKSTRISGLGASSDGASQMVSPMQSPTARSSLRMSEVPTASIAAAAAFGGSSEVEPPGPPLSSPLDRPSYHEKEGYVARKSTRASAASAANNQMGSPMQSPTARASLRNSEISTASIAATAAFGGSTAHPPGPPMASPLSRHSSRSAPGGNRRSRASNVASAGFSQSTHTNRHSNRQSAAAPRSAHRSSTIYWNRDNTDHSSSEFYSDDEDELFGFQPGAFNVDSAGVGQHAKGSLTQHPHRRPSAEMEFFPELLTLSRQTETVAGEAGTSDTGIEQEETTAAQGEVEIQSGETSSQVNASVEEAPVGDMVVGEIKPVLVEAESSKTKETQFYRKRWCWVATVIVIICAVGAGVAVSSSSSSSSDSANGEQFVTNPPTGNLASEIRLESLISYLADNEVSTREDLESSETAQGRAVNWLAMEDPMELSPETSNTRNSIVIERYVLAVFYYATNEKLSDFLNADSVCNWNGPNGKGAFCLEDSNSTVTHIMVNQTFLNGYLPSELCRLENLEYLDLSQNSLSSLTDSFSGCTKLEYLNLGDNPWGLGGDVQRFPVTLFSLSSLRELKFFRSFVRDEIPTTIGLLTNLEVLVLSFNNIFGTIPKELGNLSSLEFLDMADNDLSGSIPSEIAKTNLTHLSLRKNILEFSLPVDLLELRNLVRMDLSTNFLTGDIPRDLETLTNLVDVDLRDNFFLTGSMNGLCTASVVSETAFYTDEDISCTCCKTEG